MAYVDKILIRGIRSFDPDNDTALAFYKPLTLIVGSNGAGKTTVIECLRVACTGTLPPNARLGQSFVHDPKIARQSEVKAQIKVRFYNTIGDPFNVVRCYQLTQRATTMQFKAIDQSLKRLDPNTNEMTIITQTCADMDKIVPSLMGVSKAVLDNVIFVHQDEANWPLGEPKVLKEKFDLLFGTSRYTKWLEGLRKFRLEKMNELKVKKNDLEHLTVTKTNAARIREQLENKEMEIGRIQREIVELDSQIQVAADELEALNQTIDRLSECEMRLTASKSNLKTILQMNKDLYAKLPDGDYDDVDDELEHAMTECDEREKLIKSDVNQLDERIVQLQQDMHALKEKYSKACQHHGKLHAEMAAHERERKERDDCIAALITELSLPDDEDHDPEEFISVFEGFVLEAEKRYEEIEVKNKETAGALTEELQNVNFQIDSMTEKSRLLRQEKSQNELKRKQLSNKAIEIVINESDLDELQAQEKAALEKLEANRSQQQSSNLAASIDAAVAEIKVINDQIKKLREERDSVSEASEQDSKIKWKRQELQGKREQVTKMMETNRDSILGVFGREVEPSAIKRAYASAKTTLDKDLSAALNQLKKETDAQSEAASRARITEAELKKKEHEFIECRQKLLEGLTLIFGKEVDVDDYETLLTELEKECQDVMDGGSIAGASVKLLKTYIRQANTHGLCPMCERDFTEAEKEDFISKKEEELQNLPSQIKDKEGRAKELNERVSQLRKLQPCWIQYSMLRDDTIPKLRSDLDDFASGVDACAAKVKEAQRVYDGVQQKMDVAKGVSESIVWPLDSLLQSIKSGEECLRELESQAIAEHDGRLLCDVLAELEEQEAKRAEQESKKDRLQKQQQELSSQFMTLSQEHLQLKSEIERYRANAVNRELYEDKAAEIEKRNEDLEKELTEVEQRLSELHPEKQRLEKTRKEERQRASKEERAAEQQMKDKRRQLEGLVRKVLAVKDFEASDTPRDLEAVQQLIKDLDEEEHLMQQKINQKLEDRRSCIEEIQAHQNLRRSIQDCLKWRKGKWEEQELEEKIQTIESEMEQLGTKQALTRKQKRLQKDLEQLRDKQSRISGSLATLESTVLDMKEEMTSDLYKDIDLRHKRAMVDKAILQMGADDLQTFHKACEKALVTYHSMKMEEINASIRELWLQIYKGSDIERIEIKAEEVKGHAGRSHTYRLSMFVNGSELEMRGRCSAGQKVLAGIIVRLALAETFCAQCGILALDEPTTNLDAQNVESLADALRDIIESRQQQENFQLIVITHDDKFARRIRSREHAEYMWRVTKDNQNHSLITRERI